MVTAFVVVQVLVLASVSSTLAFQIIPVAVVVVPDLYPIARGCCLERCKSSSRSSFGSTHSALHAVTFRYSSSSFDHLKALDDKPASTGSEKNRDTHNTANTAMNTAIVGALGSMVAAVSASLWMLPTEYENVSLLLGAASAGFGYFALGGPEAREASKPQNGGYDSKFVVDKPGRLRDVLQTIHQQHNATSKYQDINQTIKVVESESNRDRSDAFRLMKQVHGQTYIDELKNAVEDSKATKKVRRLHPTVMRTLVDEHSFDAAVDGVADWIDAIDDLFDNHNNKNNSNDHIISNNTATDNQKQLNFCLTRPPSHHACKSRGSGGCLLNGPAIASFRAIEKGATSVSILDIDAHHGNGIAHCVQDDARIRYCSLHETVVEKNWFQSSQDFEKKSKSADPRSPHREDKGPLGNICNIPLPKGTTWETGYRKALLEEALPFLTNHSPDVLIVAAGFDALAVDSTSKLALQPKDYKAMGKVLQSAFGNKVVMGLEGGYVWKDGTLGTTVLELVQPWTTHQTVVVPTKNHPNKDD